MSFYIGWAEKLQATRLMLEDVKRQVNNPRNYQKKIGFLEYYLRDSDSTIKTKMLDNANNSQYRPVEIRYTPYDADRNIVESESSANCDKVAINRDKIQIVQPTLYTEKKFTIEENYVRENTESGDSLARRLEREFQSAMLGIRENMNKQLFAKAAGLFGANPAGATGAGSYFNIQLLLSAGTVDPNNFDVIANHKMDNYMNGRVALIGLGNARKYMNRLVVGSPADGGYDVNDIMSSFGMALYPDHFTTTSLGAADRILAIYEGLSQVYTYNLNRGVFDMEVTATHIKGTMPDPVLPGLTYDYILKYDDNCQTGNGRQGAWVGRVMVDYDLWNIPEDAFGDSYGSLNDFNGIVGYNITQE
jgi:hypothetical protein